MREAVVLMNGMVIYLDAITNDSIYNPLTTEIIFDYDTGRVKQFSKDGRTYMAFYAGNSNKISDFLFYINADVFWKSATLSKKDKVYIADTPGIFSDAVFKVINEDNFSTDVAGFGIIDVDPGTIVIMGKEMFDTVENSNQELENKFSFHKESFTYPERTLKDNENIGLGISSLSGYTTYPEIFLPVVNNDVEEYVYSFDIKQYKRIVNGQEEYYFSEYKRLIITEIAFLFNKIYRNSQFLTFLNNPANINVQKVFQKHFDIINKVDGPGYNGAQSFFHDIYTESFMNLFRVRLIEFYTWMSSVNINEQENIDIFVRVISLFSEKELMELDYLTKVDILHTLLRDNLWVKGRWSLLYSGNKLSEEETIVKLIRSFYREDVAGNPVYTEINDFLDYLASKPKYDKNSSKTLFEVLYRKIDDNVFFDNDKIGAQGKYVQAIYMLWAESKYNPNHSNSVIADNADALFNYTPYQAISTPQGGEIAAPRIINYESTKTFLGFIDNYDFDFKTINGLHKIASIEKKSASAGSDAIRGYYHIYQPVIIKQTNADDTIVRVPKENGATPIFYLMYVDQKGDGSDIITTAGVAVDIVLSFVGLSTYKSIGYLSKVSTFRKYLTGGLTAAEEILFITNVAKGLSAAQAVLVAAHSIYNFATNDCLIFQGQNPSNPGQNNPQYPLYNLCKQIDEWLFTVEMLTFSTDLLAQRTFKRATRRLISAIPAGDVYNDVRNAVDDLGDLSDELDDFLIYLYNNYQSIYDIVILMSDENKINFMLDFAGKNDILDLLKVNIFLIHESWEKIIYLTNFRKDFNTLKRYREIVNNQWLQTHTNFGHTKFKNSSQSSISEGISTGGHNVNNYVPPPPSVGGEISWKIPPPVKYTDPLDTDNSYSLGTMQRNLSDIVDPLTGNTWVGGNKPDGTRGGPLKNKTQNACWPKNYNTQRINEEKAVVLGKINVNTQHILTSGQYHYEISATDGHPIKVIFDGNPNNGGILNNIFPSNDSQLFHLT